MPVICGRYLNIIDMVHRKSISFHEIEQWRIRSIYNLSSCNSDSENSQNISGRNFTTRRTGYRRDTRKIPLYNPSPSQRHPRSIQFVMSSVVLPRTIRTISLCVPATVESVAGQKMSWKTVQGIPHAQIPSENVRIWRKFALLERKIRHGR